jgi:hypothetical protein
MANEGSKILEIGKSRAGQSYVVGANVPLNNARWSGPWDNAEFASWSAFQAYGLLFGVGSSSNVARAEPFSGHWYADAQKRGRMIPWREALHIPGAVLIRRPTPGLIGHVAFAIGDGKKTLEARSKQHGVGVFSGADTRSWNIGCLLPGVDYDAPPAGLVERDDNSFPAGYLWLKRPRFRGPDIVALQRALTAANVDTGGIDGDFGAQTRSALISYQVMQGLEVDGVFGPSCARALGLKLPIQPSAADQARWQEIVRPPAPPPVVLPVAPSVATIDPVTEVALAAPFYRAKTASGFSFIVGSAMKYTDDMQRLGLGQGKTAIADSLQFGVYKAADFTGDFGPWAHFIEPTLNAEGGARFGTLNSYDRAAFTFGAPQLAAHTPGENFVEYFRRLLALPEAPQHFPELSLRPGQGGVPSIHLKEGSSFINLEAVAEVVRPNGRKEKQLTKLMAYLNPSPTLVDQAELLAAARLLNWLRQDKRARALQIDVFIAAIKDKLATAKRKMPAFTGADWRSALWIMDILHQGRGNYADMGAALSASDPQAAFRKIGAPKYKSRIDTVATAMQALDASGKLNGFTV